MFDRVLAGPFTAGRRRAAAVAVIAVAGLMLSITTYYVIHRADEEARHAEAERRVGTHTKRLAGVIDRKLQALRFLHILFAPAVAPVRFPPLPREPSVERRRVRDRP